MQQQQRKPPSTPQQGGKKATVEELQTFITLHSREKFERNALMIEEKTSFTDLMKQVITLPMTRKSSLPSIYSYSSTASPSPKLATSGPSTDAKNPNDLVRRDQMAWETYEIRSREMRRVRESGVDDLVPRPQGSKVENVNGVGAQSKSPHTTDSVPSDQAEFEEDALFAARNLRLMHARRRRAEGHAQAQSSKPPQPAQSGSGSGSSFPPINQRASTPQDQGRRSSTPTSGSKQLPRLSTPTETTKQPFGDPELLNVMRNEEGFLRASLALEEQAGRAALEKKYKLHIKVAQLKSAEKRMPSPSVGTRQSTVTVNVPEAKPNSATPPRAPQPASSGSPSTPPTSAARPESRPEAQKQLTAVNREEMSQRMQISENEDMMWKSTMKRHADAVDHIKERSHRIRPHTEVSNASSNDSAHAKSVALLDARKASHKKMLDNACRLIMDEEDLERDDIMDEYEESYVNRMVDPFCAQMITFLALEEGSKRSQIDRLQDRVFARDYAALEKYLASVEPLVEMHLLSCEELLKHSESMVELLTGTAKERVYLSADETNARVELVGVEAHVWETFLQHAGKTFHFSNQCNALFASFWMSMAQFGWTSMELAHRQTVEMEASQSLVAIIDQQHANAQGTSQFNEWNALATELFRAGQRQRAEVFSIFARSAEEHHLMSLETGGRLRHIQNESAARVHLRKVEEYVAQLIEYFDDVLAWKKKEMQSSKHELLHLSTQFKTLPIEIQEAARRVRERDTTFNTFVAEDAAAFTPNDFLMLMDVLKHAPTPIEKVRVKCGSSHALQLYECNPRHLELIECGLEDIDTSSLGFLEYLSDPTCRLESLVLDGNDLTDLTIRKYLRVLKYKNHTLKHISIRENVDVLENLQHALSYLADLNCYTEDFKRLMVRAQENDASLRSIDLSEFVAQQSTTDSTGKLVPSGDACIRLLCLSLQSNTNCSSLSVANFGFSESGARNIATLLQTNRTISKLDVSNNHIGIAGVGQIAQSASTSMQKCVVIFSNNYTTEEVEKEEAAVRKSTTKYEDFERGFISAFCEMSEARVLRLSQMVDKKQQAFNKYEAPYIRQKVMEEQHEKERLEMSDDETTVRTLISERFDDSIQKMKQYSHQRLKDVERISRDRSSLLLFHTVLLEQELERAAQVTIIEKILRRQAVLDAEFWFHHLKTVEEQHESLISHLQLHYGECVEYYMASEREVRKIADLLARQPFAIREVVFTEKLKMMQRMDVSAAATNGPSTALSSSVEILPNVVIPTVSTVTPSPMFTTSGAVRVTVPLAHVSPPRTASPPAIKEPTVVTSPLTLRSMPMAAMPAALPTAPQHSPTVPPPVSAPQLYTAPSPSAPIIVHRSLSPASPPPTHPPPSINFSPQRRQSVEKKPVSVVDSLMTSREDYRTIREDREDFPVRDESIVLMHDIICNGGAPVDRVNLAYRAEHVNFNVSMPLIEEMSMLIEVLDLSGCGLTDTWIPAIKRIMNAPNTKLRILSIKDNPFSVSGLREIVDELKQCSKSIDELHLGNDDDAVQVTSTVRHLRDLSRFYLAMRGPLGGRFKKLMIDVEANEPFVKALDFSNTVVAHRRRRDFAQKRLRKTKPSSGSSDPSPARALSRSSSHDDDGTFGNSDSGVDSSTTATILSGADRNHNKNALLVDDVDEGVLSENAFDVPPPLDDEAVQLVCFALAHNEHVKGLSLRGNNITEKGGRRILKFLREHGDETSLEWIDIRENFIPEEVTDEINKFFQDHWKQRFTNEVIGPEARERAKLIQHMQYDDVFVPLGNSFLHTMRQFATVETQWFTAHSDVYNFFVAKGRMDLAVVDPEVAHRKEREAIVAQFYEKARIYLMLLNYRSEKYLKYRTQKEQAFQEEEVMTNKVGKMILTLDPNLQAVAVHIARNNKYVDMLDLSSTPLEPRCNDDVIQVMTGLMKQNTFVKEVSLANSGGYFNAHRSMPLIAEMGTRLETLDMTNCHLTDGHVGALCAMLQAEDCTLETLVLDENYLSSVGARKLAKAIRNSQTLSCVSLNRNSNMSMEDQKLIQFYCDLNKYTKSFKEMVLRVEANDPSLSELHFDRKGNLDERSVFDDVSMRLLCAALPHNTHVERIFLQGNHVSDEGALCLLNLLKSKVNRSVYVVDLSGNDVSPALVDELNKLVLIRLSETIDQTVFNPEDIARTNIASENRSFWFWMDRLKKISWNFNEELREYEEMKSNLIVKMFHEADLDHQILQYERRYRKQVEDEEKMFAAVSEYVHDSVVRGYQPIVLDYMRAMRRMFMSAQQEMEDLLEELNRQPNIELRRNALWILNNLRRIESLDLSSTLPSDFCEQEILCNGRTVDIALRVLSKNKTVKRLSLANNSGRVPGWGEIWPLSRRLESLDLSRCGLTDSEVPNICSMISDPQSTLRELILDGNLFSEVGCMDIMRTLRHNIETRSDFLLTKLSVQECPHVSENLISTIDFMSELLRCTKPFRDLMMRLRFSTDEIRTVDAQDMSITDDMCKLLCIALKPHKTVRSIKLRRNLITDIGVDYLCRLVKATPTIEYVDILENDVSSIARRQLASMLEERLGKRIGNDVEVPEEFHREDVMYEESQFPRFFWHYNRITPNVFAHYQRAVDLYVNYAGRIWGINAVFIPEKQARQGSVEAMELQQRMMLYKWMQYHQWIVSFMERTQKQKAQWIAEGNSAVRELAGLVANHPSRELREKAFKIALNSANVMSLSLVQQCDENAVVILGKILKGNTYVKELNLSGNHQIKPSWVLPLIGEANTNMEVLNLSDCNLRDGDVADPLRILLGQPKCKITRAILDRNFLTQVGIQRIVPVLRETNHLVVELSLKHNPELSRAPLQYLDFCLELNRYISVGHEHGKREDYLRIKALLIDVEANRPDISTLNFVNDEYALLMLDDQFAKLVCIALAHNSHVRTLYIRGHQVTDKGAQYILQLLQGVNRTLDFVDLHGNFVSDSMLLAIEYAIPWRHYAADLDRLLQSAVDAFEQLYNAYEQQHFQGKREHQLYIIRPCFDSRAEIEKDEDMVFRKLLSRYPEWLRFADAWHKSYKYAFQRTYLQAEETLPTDVSFIDRRLSRTVVDALSPLSPKKEKSAGKLLDAVSALKAQLLPDFLRQKYLKFVSLSDLYEQKCVSALEKVFASCSPVNASQTEAFLSSAYSPARIPSIYVPAERVPSSQGIRSVTSAERLLSPTASRRSVSPIVSFRDQQPLLASPSLEKSIGFGTRVQSFVGSPSTAGWQGDGSTRSPPMLSSPPLLHSPPSGDYTAANPFSGSLMRVPSMGNFGESFYASPASKRESSPSGHFNSSQFAEITGIDEEKLLMKLIARYERLNEQVITYEGKCAELLQNQFRLAANDLAFVGRNRKIHGPQCDDRCVCSIIETTVDKARKLHDRLTQRFNKYVTQVANFEDVCISALNSYYDESRLALLELKKLLLRRTQAEIDASNAVHAKLSNRFERYVATVDEFEKKCVVALQKAFDVHAAPVERQIEDALMRRQIVDERHAEAAELHSRLHQRYLRYESVMADFETKCRGAKERLVKPDIDALIISRRESLSSRERRTVSFVDSDNEGPPGALPSVKSFFSTPQKVNPMVVKLQTRFEKYKQQVEEFTANCMSAYEAVFLREKSKLETGSTASFRRVSSMSSRESAAASEALNRAPSLRRIDSMAAIVSPDAKTEQALQLLPTQPLPLQRVGRLIANNDPTVLTLDLSSTSDPRPVNDTTIGILFTLLRSNNQLRELNLANQGQNLTITSMKLLSRLGRKLEKIDLSNGMIENQLLAPTICAMLSVPECTLTTLNLNNNKLSQEGALQIMQVMRKTNQSLTSVSLQGNEGIDKASISFLNFYCDLNRFVPIDAKFKSIVLAAEKNDENVTEILLKNVGYVDDLAVRCLCVALARNTSVTVVNLSGNSITDKSVKHIVQLLGINTAISRFDVSANRFSQDGVTSLRRAASDSKVSTFIV